MNETTATPAPSVTTEHWVRVRPRAVAGAALALLVVLAGGVALGSTWQAADAPVSVPRCVSDDYSDGSTPLCWTVEVNSGDVVVIDADDVVVRTIPRDDAVVSVTR